MGEVISSLMHIKPFNSLTSYALIMVVIWNETFRALKLNMNVICKGNLVYILFSFVFWDKQSLDYWMDKADPGNESIFLMI